MTDYFVTTSLVGAYLPSEPGEPFEATLDEAITALLDEAVFQLGDVFDDDDEAAFGDAALLESLRGAEGRGDLTFKMQTYGEVTIVLESVCNGYGLNVSLSKSE